MGDPAARRHARIVFSDSLAAGLSAVLAGAVIEVHGLADAATGHISATRVAAASSATRYKLRGTVAGLNSTAKIFNIGAAAISYAALASTAVPSTLANGLARRVELATAQSAGFWVASALGVKGLHTDHGNGLGGQVRGKITAFTSATRFTVDGVAAAAPPARSHASELFTHWRSNPAYCDRRGSPAELPRQGPAPSFETLAQAITRDVYPRSLLNELLRLGLAGHDAQRDSVRLLREAFVPQGDAGRMAAVLGRNVGSHLDSAVDNLLLGDRQHLEQAVFADGLSPASVAEFRQVGGRPVADRAGRPGARARGPDGPRRCRAGRPGQRSRRAGPYPPAGPPLGAAGPVHPHRCPAHAAAGSRRQSDTVFDERLSGGLAALAPGQWLEVYGFYNPGATGFAASRVGASGPSAGLRVSGTVAAVDARAQTFQLGSQTYSIAALGSSPAVDAVVTLKLQQPGTDAQGRWVVSGQQAEVHARRTAQTPSSTAWSARSCRAPALSPTVSRWTAARPGSAAACRWVPGCRSAAA